MSESNAESGHKSQPDLLFERAVAAHEQGDFVTAETLYREVLAAEPEDAATLELLGQVLLASERFDEGKRTLEKSISLDPGSAGAWFAYATALDAAGLKRDAEVAATRTLAIDPDLLDARVLLAMLRLGGIDPAAGSSDAVSIIEHPDATPSHLRLLSSSAWATNDLSLAAKILTRLESPAEDDVAAMYLLSKQLFDRNDLSAMEALLRRVHAVRADHADAARALASHLANRRLEAEAVAVLTETLSRRPEETALRLDLAGILNRLGRHAEASAVIEDASRHGGGWASQWSGAAAVLKPSYVSASEIDEGRRHLEERLLRCERTLVLESARARSEALEAVISTSFFLLPSQGLCDRDVADRVGRTIRRIVEANGRTLVDPPLRPHDPPDGRIRVGLLSGFFRSHSNWKTHLDWMSRLDPRRFEVIGFCTQAAGGRELETARRRLDRFEMVKEDPLALARRIREDRLHAVLIPEIGMDPMIRVVAAARLAPVQWCSWGHATTSGYPSVNGYLSSDLMESTEADDHYTEPLIRLPGVGGGFTPPNEQPEAVRRSDLGIGPEEVAVWCAHAPFTHLPQHDRLLIRIAERRPEVRFVFVAMAEGDPTRRRIESAFRAAGLDPDRFTRFLPRLSVSKFLGANAACDLYLDTPEWSGCNTGLETILMGCPPITLPGRFMRGRHLWAFLQRMEMPELAAWSLDEYVDLAVEMVADPDRRREAADRLSERREVLFDDPAPREALEERLEEACRSS